MKVPFKRADSRSTPCSWPVFAPSPRDRLLHLELRTHRGKLGGEKREGQRGMTVSGIVALAHGVTLGRIGNEKGERGTTFFTRDRDPMLPPVHMFVRA